MRVIFFLLLLCCVVACRTPFEQLSLQEQVKRYNDVNFRKEYLFDIPTLNLDRAHIAVAQAYLCSDVDSAAFAAIRGLNRKDFLERICYSSSFSRLFRDIKSPLSASSVASGKLGKDKEGGIFTLGHLGRDLFSTDLSINSEWGASVEINTNFSKEMHRYRHRRKKQREIYEITLHFDFEIYYLRNGNIFEHNNIFYKVVYDADFFKAADSLVRQNYSGYTFLGQKEITTHRRFKDNTTYKDTSIYMEINPPIVIIPILPDYLPVCKDIFIYPDSLTILQVYPTIYGILPICGGKRDENYFFILNGFY